MSGDWEPLAATHSSSWSSSPIENFALPLEGTSPELPFRKLGVIWDSAAPGILAADTLRFKDVVEGSLCIEALEPVWVRLMLELFRFTCAGVGLDEGFCGCDLACCFGGARSSPG